MLGALVQGLVFRGVVGFCMIHGCITIIVQTNLLGTQLGGEVPLLSGYIRYWAIGLYCPNL